MSLEDFKSFLNSDSEEFREKMKRLQDRQRSRGTSRSDSMEFIKNDLIPFARRKGFNFTVDDILNFQQSLQTDDLANVPGGLSTAGKAGATCRSYGCFRTCGWQGYCFEYRWL